MKKLTILLGTIFILISYILPAQETIPVLTHEMTPEEELRKHEIGRDFTPTDPPMKPVRMVAEFEEMQSVLIRYPFGLPMSLIIEMSQDCMVKTIVANASQQQTVLNQYISAGVNTDNCEWLLAPSNSYWTRDYGPWFVVDGNNEVGISDFPYNRPRPYDDNIPVVLSQQMGIPLYGMDLIETGGNWMCDGIGVAAQTELVWEENAGMSHQEIDTMVMEYLGINKFLVINDPLDEYIKHIDCWGKFLDVDKVLVGQVPLSDYRYEDYEFVANYFALQTTSYGNQYQVFRVYTPGTYPYTPYTNSLILNNKVFVPLTGSQWDDEALEVYENAMPGYEIVGIQHTTWENTDALHCRAKGIADVGMLHVSHMPLLGGQDFQFEWDLYADIIPYTGLSVISDSLQCYYKLNDGNYQTVPLQHMDGYSYKATIPFADPSTEISYFIRAADYSGRKKNHPYIGSPDPHVFTVDYADDAIVDPDTLVYLTVEEMVEGKSFIIYNYTDGDLIIDDIEQESYDGGFHWYIDPWSITLPYTMEMTEPLTLNVKIDIPVDPYSGPLVVDTLDILTENGLHQVIIKVDWDLISSLGDPIAQSSSCDIESITPNPFSSQTRILISMEKGLHARIVIYNLQGQMISLLADQLFTTGKHEVVWDGTDNSGNNVPPGIYLLKLETEKGVEFKKLILSK